MNQLLIERLTHNYLLLNRQYRSGRPEENVGYARKWNVNEATEREVEFYDMCEAGEADHTRLISFREAINDLYRLIMFVEKQKTYRTEGILFLRCKCLVYEATDYIFQVPQELGNYFRDEFANRFSGSAADLKTTAEELNGGTFESHDECAKVIKVLLIAAIWGANQMYREHNEPSYDRAYEVLKRINEFILKELPDQHSPARESFGILGLAQYMTGRVLLRRGLIKESRNAFREASEAYLARLRQKEDYLREKRITIEQYEEKVVVTTRRIALVAAFGDGYHYYISGQLTRALETLTVARAALSRNAGLVYLVYVEMLYWACRRSAKSSDPNTVEECVRQLRGCRERFANIIPNTQYFHRAGIQLALALLSRARINRDVGGADYQEGLRYLEDAEQHARKHADNRDYLNPSLLAGALITKSRYLKSQAVTPSESCQAEQAFEQLNRAMQEARNAYGAVPGIDVMESEALAAMGEIYVDLTELNLTYRREDFEENFNNALDTFRIARDKNRGKSPRNEAICLLGLTKLCLLNPNTDVAAREYFAQWREIETLVEHDHCKTMAKELERKFSPRDLLIRVSDSINVREWEQHLESCLIKEALKEFIAKGIIRNLKSGDLRTPLALHLQKRLGYKSTKAYEIIKERGLLNTISQMRKKPDEA